jgi:GNAT superfamily N-acetyltransferase
MLMIVRRLHGSLNPQFAQLLRIYSEAHPASERKSAETLASVADRPDYLFLVAIEEGCVLGFSIVVCFTNSNACLLEYMAVAAKLRNRGIGRLLFKKTVERREVFRRFVLLEVDSDSVPSEDRTERVRRKSFYRTMGCKQIEGLRYRMPEVSRAGPPAMDLLVYKDELPALFAREQLRKWLESCYTQVYERPADDPRIDAMLKGLPDIVRLI